MVSKKGSDPNSAKHPQGRSGYWGLTPFSVRIVAIASWIAFGTSAHACNIPVFRYALERWQSDDYEVILFHEGWVTDVDTRFQQQVRKTKCNVKFVFGDLLQPANPHRQTFKSIGEPSMKEHRHFVVRAPRRSGRDDFTFHGIIDTDSASSILDSPVRQELSRRLLSGHAIVWLMLQSDNPSANQATRRLLSNTIESLADRIELPEGIGQPGSELYSEVPLLSRFSLLEIEHDDPKEQFLRQLFSVQEDGPVVVPVFGRGRALSVIPASELTASMIDDVTVYLSGACSCQVKDRNPGFDLLLAVDWERELFGDDQPPRFKSPGESQSPQTLAIPPSKTRNP